MSKRIAYFGPAGTYTEEAALSYDASAQLLPLRTISAVASAVETGMADEGVVPIENSLEGSVLETLDILIHESRLSIRREILLPINHCLVARPGTQVPDIQVVFTHTQPLGQCRRFLERCFGPNLQIAASLSTTDAVRQMLDSDRPSAAICSKRAAELYGAEVLASGIQDRSSNVTRFVILAHEDHPRTGTDRTSFCFSYDDDKPGLLYEALRIFAERGINLSKMESRPTKEVLGRYIFLIDCHGHRTDPEVAAALESLRVQTATFKVFGSYPRED
ncbi:MAG: prephenate dehydratase [Chloroflexota bacterium]|nr:MAG: prephenate dehydratase [Chloroflexota bacterium]